MRFLLANGQHLRIREAKTEDAAALLEMFRKAVCETDFLMTTPAEAHNLTVEQERDFITDYLKNSNQLFLIGDVEGEIAGTLSVTQAKLKKQQHVGEFGIVVLQKYWNMGIARRMINAMMQWAASHPVIYYIHLKVMANNEKAIRLYQQSGFLTEGRKLKAVCQSPDNFQDIILMGKWIAQSPPLN